MDQPLLHGLIVAEILGSTERLISQHVVLHARSLSEKLQDDAVELVLNVLFVRVVYVTAIADDQRVPTPSARKAVA